ncbi:class I SAM-dependent methyltransferase [Stratiformator vulcanicus]|uniref:Putative methyltransferase n=1 Tax=Stratiformator vulcanicus TaxID=2527980 RepID=A0A517QVZ2_9PLAN|nr:class I SAM-dependent methyltransferase [Stratiformator vulcanicus]QDT35764.1 putative methyltransferase [Stratiformator vulcanicus]
MTATESAIASLKRRRAKIEDDLTTRGRAHTYSLARYNLHQMLTAEIKEHVRGHCLDAGAGRGPFQALLRRVATSVTAIDVTERPGITDAVGDVQSMPEFANESFDSLICSQVLEHVPRPWDAFAEFARVLKPGGMAIISVPHLSMIHEAPHDYYRYTEYGLKSLAEQSGFSVVDICPTGGLISFLGHFVSQVTMTTAGGLPIIGGLFRLFNLIGLVYLLSLLDRLGGLRMLFPCDYCAVFQKKK